MIFRQEFLNFTFDTENNFINGLNFFKSQLSEKEEFRNQNSIVLVKIIYYIKTTDKQHFIDSATLISEYHKSFFKDTMPAYTIVGQAPGDGSKITLEVLEVNNEKNIIYCKSDNYVKIHTNSFDCIISGGICDYNNSSKFEDSCVNVFNKIEHILKNENMDFGNIVRQWNFIEDITRTIQLGNKQLQHYQIFNDVRTLYYNKSNFTNGYPAATGIGAENCGVIVDFIAIKTNNEQPKTHGNSHFAIVPVSNPFQTDAHRYGTEVLEGQNVFKELPKTTPKFERAKLLIFNNNNILFISGTASIRNQETLHIGDVKQQTLLTIDNIFEIIKASGKFKIEDIKKGVYPCFLRVYVKYISDCLIIKEICEETFPNSQIIYLQADVCRNDLLVEIEGILGSFNVNA